MSIPDKFITDISIWEIKLSNHEHFHPYIWKHVCKMLNYCYGSTKQLQRGIRSMALEKTVTGSLTNKDLIEFLSNLSMNDSYKVLRDMLELTDFWPDENDIAESTNYSNALMEEMSSPITLFQHTKPRAPIIKEERLWGSKLVELLEKKEGISYDRSINAFVKTGIKNTMIFPYSRPRTAFLIQKFSHDKIANDPWYKKLSDEINTTYLGGLYTSTTILSRKLIENLSI